MVDDSFSTQSERFSQIAADIAQFVGSTALPIWAYIEAGDGWVQPSIFQERLDAAEYVDHGPPVNGDLCDLIMAAWDAEAPDKRWAAMEMDIADGRFTTRLRYHDDVPRDDGYGSTDRSDTALAARFGDKPVIYPD